jgi:hypothetical protein
MKFKYQDTYYPDAERLWQTLPVAQQVILEKLGHELALSNQDKPLHGVVVRHPHEIKRDIVKQLVKFLPGTEQDTFKISVPTLENEHFSGFLKSQHENAMAMAAEEQAGIHVQELNTLGIAREIYTQVLAYGEKKAAEHKNRLTSL